jgi:hypothetical protein
MIVAIYSSNVDPINPFPEKAGSDFFWRLSFLILHIGQMSCAMAVLGPESGRCTVSGNMVCTFYQKTQGVNPANVSSHKKPESMAEWYKF